MKRKRTPWFNLLRQPPVRPGVYEHWCGRFPHMGVNPRHTNQLLRYTCPDCEWRGLAERTKR